MIHNPATPVGQLLEGKVAVITGATAGIGRGIAERFIREGAQVLAVARGRTAGEAMAASHPGKMTFVTADAANPAELEKVAAVAVGLGGGVDVVVCNAGGGAGTWVATSSEAEYDAVMDANVKSAFFTVQKLLPVMNDGAAIILIGSIAGSGGGLGAVCYNAAKAAVRSLARSITAELAPRQIRANCLAPGPIQTAGFERFIDGDEAKRAGVIAGIPVGHVGVPADAGAVALFLATDASRYIAGVELTLDGGLSQI
ncbi:MAG: SDR family oxidoreductase [Bifidobacteriaceae bacterium]|jgi:NAD(P)-dependent dehydrogenase (short-subunit alcohol dehydrogenase family)|nr:SDR family oxidoreductase [Bifidobacteriaceae bacterium]